MSTTSPAYSQAARKSGAEIETVVVPGIRPGLAKSLEARRESQTVVDVLTADKNVAVALQRVSGVSISREFGDGERASIRFNYLKLPI